MSTGESIEPLTKEKKPRTAAQLDATKKMREALEKKRLTPTEKKLRLKAIKDQLNGTGNTDVKEEDNEDLLDIPQELLEQKPKKVLKVGNLGSPTTPPLKVGNQGSPTTPPLKKEPKVVYESGSEQSEEIIVVKKKKKPKKKTIIYEESESENEEIFEPQPRETKSQKNVKSKFKVSNPKPEPICYFE